MTVQHAKFNVACPKCPEKSKEKVSCTSLSQGSHTAAVCFQTAATFVWGRCRNLFSVCIFVWGVLNKPRGWSALQKCTLLWANYSLSHTAETSNPHPVWFKPKYALRITNTQISSNTKNALTTVVKGGKAISLQWVSTYRGHKYHQNRTFFQNLNKSKCERIEYLNEDFQLLGVLPFGLCNWHLYFTTLTNLIILW